MYLWDFLAISAFGYRFTRKRIGEFSHPIEFNVASSEPLDTKILSQHDLHSTLPSIRAGYVGVHHFGAPKEPFRSVGSEYQHHLIMGFNVILFGAN